jgi:trimeric autotransporter adhesin
VLTISGITITGTDAKDFREKNECGTSLPAGGSCKISVTFTPKEAENLAASLQISYTAGGGPQLVLLSGTGVPTSTVSLTPSKLDFPVQLFGTTSSEQTATLTNTGSSAVMISKISTAAPFSQTNNCPSSLAAGQSCQIDVSFKPTLKGKASGELSVKDDATGSPQMVALSEWEPS